MSPLPVHEGADNTENAVKADPRSPSPKQPYIIALANRLGISPEEVVERVPADTLRRMRHAAIAQTQPDGSTAFIHNVVDTHGDGIRSSVSTDRGAHAGITPGAKHGGYGSGADTSAPSEKSSPGRDSGGRFTRSK